MKQDKKQTILGLFTVILLFFLSYLLVANVWNIFLSVDPRIGSGLVAAFAAVLVSLVSALVSKHLDRKAAILANLREKKIPTYEKIIDFIFSITFAEKLGKEKVSDKEIVKFMTEITPELVIWGSDEILNEFYRFRRESIKNSSNFSPRDPYNFLFTLEDLLLAIRKDLGHKNKNVLRGKILGLFINDLPSQVE